MYEKNRNKMVNNYHYSFSCYNRNFILFRVQYLSSKWAKLIYTYNQWIYWKDKKLSLHQFNDNPLTVLIQ